MIIKTIIVFFSISPLLAAYFDNFFFKYITFFFLMLLYLLNITIKKKLFQIPISFFFIILISLIHFFIQLVFGVGYGSGGIILLLLESFLIFQLIKLSKKIDYDDIISFFLKLSLSYLYFEFFMRLFGFEYIFIELFGYAENVNKFKDYNSTNNYVLSLGFKGLNSFFLGSQISSILSLITAIYFIGKKFYLKEKNFKLHILIILSLIMYLITMTQTSNLLFSLLILFIFFFTPSFFGIKRLSLKLFIFYFVAIIFFILGEVILKDIIFFKLNEQKDVDIYLSLLIDPYNEYLRLNFNEILLGIGRSEWTFDATSDLGFFAILFRVGLPYFSIFSFFIIFIIIKSYKKSLYKEISNYLSFQLLISSFFIFTFWGSLIHYTSSVEIGCREIFAFQIAYVFFLLQKNKIM